MMRKQELVLKKLRKRVTSLQKKEKAKRKKLRIAFLAIGKPKKHRKKLTRKVAIKRRRSQKKH